MTQRTEHPGGIVDLRLMPEGQATEGQVTEGAVPDWAAGAHIELALPSGRVRAYSLSNLPGEGSYRLGVKVEANGTGGSAELGALRTGDRLHASRPGNNYPVPEDRPHYVLCAGGIKVTVMVPLALRLRELGRSFEVHYSMKDAAQAVFANGLRDASNGLLTVHTERGWLAAAFEGLLEGTTVCACGPQGYMEAVTVAASAAGLPADAMLSEAFAGQDGHAFDIVLASSGERVRVAEGDSIACALGRRGVHVPVSCGYGVCGICTLGVLDGEPDHRDRILADGNRARKVTTCCSRAVSDTLTLDI